MLNTVKELFPSEAAMFAAMLAIANDADREECFEVNDHEDILLGAERELAAMMA